MGMYINVGNAGFQRARNGEYVDKSELIAVINQTLFTEYSFSCVSRCRRFGKSMAAKMLCAYYDQSCDSRQLFADL
ncbi:MAG: AAA family ATPase, partial [Prevotella sp.]|nr:AAA family ATPase [Prevotella sp.]